MIIATVEKAILMAWPVAYKGASLLVYVQVAMNDPSVPMPTINAVDTARTAALGLLFVAHY